MVEGSKTHLKEVRARRCTKKRGKGSKAHSKGGEGSKAHSKEWSRARRPARKGVRLGHALRLRAQGHA
jgi:hypothetical protein